MLPAYLASQRIAYLALQCKAYDSNPVPVERAPIAASGPVAMRSTLLATPLLLLVILARAGGGPFGIDYELGKADTGIFSRGAQTGLEYGSVAFVTAGGSRSCPAGSRSVSTKGSECARWRQSPYRPRPNDSHWHRAAS